MTVKLLTAHHLKFQSFKGGFTSSSKPAPIKMPHCWKSHTAAHIQLVFLPSVIKFYKGQAVGLFVNVMGTESLRFPV